jgi:hypothetical protein
LQVVGDAALAACSARAPRYVTLSR